MTTANQVDVGLSGASGSGAFAGNVSPSFTTPVLGVPTSGTLTNCTGLPAAGIVGTSNGGIFYSNASTGAILAATATAQQLLMSGASTAPQWSTTTYPLTNAINTIMYASSANVLGVIAAANSSVLISSAGGVPSMSTTLPSGLSATNLTLITPAIGTPSAGVLTNCTGLPAAGIVGTSNGGIFYSTASTGAILSGTATSGQSLLSGASSTPQWTTTTYPTTNAINTIMYASSANVLGSITAANSGVLVTTSAGVPGWSGTMTNGQVIIGSTTATPVAATLTAGTGITITNGAGTITIATDAEGTWVNQNSASVTMSIGTGYTVNNGASLVTLTLPASAAIGDYVEINGQSAGGWSIAQASGQLIHIGNHVTTTGTGGSLSSTNQYDCVRLRCIVANTTWTVVSQQSGGLTYV